MPLPDREPPRRRSKSVSPRPINVGLIGMGNVGKGVARFFQERHGEPHNINLRRVAVADPSKPRELEVQHLIGDAKDIFQDPQIDIVVEVVGGTGRARDFVFDAIDVGKSIVTANKAVIAQDMRGIFDAARDRVDVGFEASVAGGVPIIDTLREYRGQGISRIRGVLNGTTNFILNRMEEGLDFNEAVRIAQRRGFAEADHSLDTGGFDTRAKLAILTSLTTNAQVDPESIDCRGITDITPFDLDFAAKYGGGRGHAVKLLAVADRQQNGNVELRVNPALIRREDHLAAVIDEENGISLDGDLVGGLTLIGKGAGTNPTTSAVIRDIFHIAENLRGEVVDPLPTLDAQVTFVPPGPTEGYLRVNLVDGPGSLHAALGILAEHGLSIKNTTQSEEHAYREDGTVYVPDIITVEKTPRGVIENVLVELGALERVHGNPVFMSIES